MLWNQCWFASLQYYKSWCKTTVDETTQQTKTSVMSDEEDEKIEFICPTECVCVNGKKVNIPSSVRSAITVYGTMIDDLNAAVKIASALRKRINPAKKAIEEFMSEQQVEGIKIGPKVYSRKRKPKAFVDMKHLKGSKVLGPELKRAFIAENTKDNDTFKLE